MLYIVRCYTYNTPVVFVHAKLTANKSRVADQGPARRRRLSQERFALKIGMDRTYLASIEVGGRNVTLQNLAKIANGFDMTLSEFFEGIPRIDPRE